MDTKTNLLEQTFTFNCQKYEEVCKWFTNLIGEYRSPSSQVAVEWVDNTNHDISFNIKQQEPIAFNNNYSIVIFLKDKEHIINFLKFMLERRVKHINMITDMATQTNNSTKQKELSLRYS